MDKQLFLGADVGTTTVCVAVTGDGRPCAATGLDSGAFAEAGASRREQSPEMILSAARSLIDAALSEHPEIRAIGLDGQMHGIVYLDRAGAPVSNLITWQDPRAGEKVFDGESAVDIIGRKSGYLLHAGYGAATHMYMTLAGEVPVGAAYICTAADYVGAALTGRESPLVHVSNAASMGMFDHAKGDFDRAAIEKCGMDASLFPGVTGGAAVLGEYKGRPVYVALGDNQAAYLGAAPDGGVLLNFGTGSQISVEVDAYAERDGVECRPYVDGKYILSGSALCGGRSYALLERFFRDYMRRATGRELKQYDLLDSLAEEGWSSGNILKVDTRFAGTRGDEGVLGAVLGISEDNFTPAALAAGFLCGMVDELYEYYAAMGLEPPERLILSGNAARKTPILCRIAAARFGAEATISPLREEAACGSAEFARRAYGA